MIDNKNVSGGIDILSCNVKDGMSDPCRVESIVDALIERQPTVAFLSEAYRFAPGVPDNGLPWLDDALNTLEANGYAVIGVEQEVDPNRRRDAHGIMMIAKEDHLRSLRFIRLSGRYALVAEMTDPATGQPYNVYGHQGDDEKEWHRLQDQTVLDEDLPRDADGNLLATAIITSNTMLRKGWMAHLLHSAKGVSARVARWLHVTLPDPENPPRIDKRIASLAQRLSGQATGLVYNKYIQMGFRNADRIMQTTLKQLGFIRVKTDHIFVTPHFDVEDHSIERLEGSRDAGLHAIKLHHVALRALLRLRTMAAK